MMMSKIARLLDGRGYIIGLIVALAVASVVVVFQHGREPSHNSQPTASTSPEPTLSSTPTPGLPSSTPTASQDPQNAKQKLLITQVGQFVQTYYSVTPTDTEATRHQRVAATNLVPADVLSQLSLSLATGTEADTDRIKAGYVLGADIVTDSLIAEPIDDQDPNTVEVNVPVASFQLWPDGHIVQYPASTTISDWTYTNNTWQLLSFDEGGGNG